MAITLFNEIRAFLVVPSPHELFQRVLEDVVGFEYCREEVFFLTNTNPQQP